MEKTCGKAQNGYALEKVFLPFVIFVRVTFSTSFDIHTFGAYNHFLLFIKFLILRRGKPAGLSGAWLCMCEHCMAKGLFISRNTT